MSTAFIFGHGDVTDPEFQEHYVPKLTVALAQGHSFVVGDFKGADTLAQRFLRAQNAEGRVTVYHMFDRPRTNAGWPCIGGFKNDEERDSAMTRASQYDIGWIRPGREKSGSAKNLRRNCP